MEELDDLKSIWKKQKGFERKGETEIAQMLNGKSNTLITRLKRNVWFELIFTLICMVALGGYALTLDGGALVWTIVALLGLLLVYTAYYVKKLILLNQYDQTSENLKANLTNLLARLDAYMTFYKRSYTFLYPFFFALGIIFGLLESGTDRFMEKFQSTLYTVSFIVLSIVFMIGIYTITDWYMKKLYGNHIEKLKSLLAELEVQE
jgi:ABC-type multidrug transport system fused ATPase/permease subunit